MQDIDSPDANAQKYTTEDYAAMRSEPELMRLLESADFDTLAVALQQWKKSQKSNYAR